MPTEPTSTSTSTSTSPPLQKDILIQHCARCGGDHVLHGWKVFVRPIEDPDGTVWALWQTCPVTGDPILARLLPPEGEPVPEAAQDADHTDA